MKKQAGWDEVKRWEVFRPAAPAKATIYNRMLSPGQSFSDVLSTLAEQHPGTRGHVAKIEIFTPPNDPQGRALSVYVWCTRGSTDDNDQ